MKNGAIKISRHFLCLFRITILDSMGNRNRIPTSRWGHKKYPGPGHSTRLFPCCTALRAPQHYPHHIRLTPCPDVPPPGHQQCPHPDSILCPKSFSLIRPCPPHTRPRRRYNRHPRNNIYTLNSPLYTLIKTGQSPVFI